MFLLVLLGAMFMRGFREVIGLAVVIVGVYLVLNADRRRVRASRTWSNTRRSGTRGSTRLEAGRVVPRRTTRSAASRAGRR